jgi:ketosteroid isomerase-like protein
MEHAAETARTREVVATFYQNYRDRNFDALARGLSEEIDFCIEISQDYFPFAGSKRGRDATVASLKELVGAIEHLQYDEVFTLADGARACVFLHCRVRDRATGAESKVDLCDLLELKDGQIIWFREFLDTLSATEQMMGKTANFA